MTEAVYVHDIVEFLMRIVMTISDCSVFLSHVHLRPIRCSPSSICNIEALADSTISATTTPSCCGKLLKNHSFYGTFPIRLRYFGKELSYSTQLHSYVHPRFDSPWVRHKKHHHTKHCTILSLQLTGSLVATLVYLICCCQTVWILATHQAAGWIISFHTFAPSKWTLHQQLHPQQLDSDQFHQNHVPSIWCSTSIALSLMKTQPLYSQTLHVTDLHEPR